LVIDEAGDHQELLSDLFLSIESNYRTKSVSALEGRIYSEIRRPASGNLAFHSMDLLGGLREVGGKNDSFGMPALVTVCW